MFRNKPLTIVSPDQALPGRQQQMVVTPLHFVTGRNMHPPFPANVICCQFALGCFWGAEKKFWSLEGVYTTAVGYAGGYTPNPTYQEVCSGLTGHTEVVLVAYDPNRISYTQLLAVFWESHDPTQGMRQGNDIGTQYRSAIYTYDLEQMNIAQQSLQNYQQKLRAAGYPRITTELATAPAFYYAEDYHQQYLAKNPKGYCGLGGTGVSCN